MNVIELTAEDLALFLAFREHQEAIATILASGMLAQRGATIQVYVDPKGVITTIDVVRKPLFSRRPIASPPESV